MAQIPSEIFYQNLSKIVQTWSQDFDSSYDLLCIANGKSNSSNQTTISIISWIFGAYNITDTVILLTRKNIWIITSARKIEFLSNLKEKNQHGITLQLIEKQSSNNSIYEGILKKLKISNLSVGFIDKSSSNEGIGVTLLEFFSQKKIQIKESLPLFAKCLKTKRPDQIEEIRRSAFSTCYFMKRYISEMQKILDNNKKFRHNELVKLMEKCLNNQGELKKCALKTSKLSPSFDRNYVDTGPIQAQSGENFAKQIFPSSNQQFLKQNCIVLGLGTLYKNYNTFICRTFLINASSEQENLYKNVLTLHRTISQNLRTGKKLSEVYSIGCNFMKENMPNLSVPSNFGFSSGVLIEDHHYLINAECHQTIKEGQLYFIVLNFPRIDCVNSKGHKIVFGIKVIDSVIITKQGLQILTDSVGIAYKDISYELDSQSACEQLSETFIPMKNPQINQEYNRPVTRRGKKHQATMNNLKDKKVLQEHQKQLKKKKMQELRQRVNENFMDKTRSNKIQCSRLIVYKANEQLPKGYDPKKIHVDEKRNGIILPLMGKPVPFHIFLIKNVVRIDEGNQPTLRFNFYTPTFSSPQLSFPRFNDPKVFIKELVFRSKDKSKFALLEKQIKNLQKKSKLQLKEKKTATEQVMQQQSIKLNKGKRPILRDLFMRPSIGQKKIKGILECHLNGFRYSPSKGEPTDIIFSNIRYAFVQPCEREMIAAIHFRLQEPILVNKKKSEDVQFYTDCGTILEQIQGKRGSFNDQQDDEEKIKQSRRKLDRQISYWVKGCDEYKGNIFTFEFPDRSEGFYGCPYISTILLQPTQRCLINIVETKFFIVVYEQIEVVCFERMYNNTRYFDLVIIMKDYEHFHKIGQIAMTEVDRVKKLFDKKNIIFYEQGRNLNWGKFLGGIRKDFSRFVDDNAWLAWDQIDEEMEVENLENDESFEMGDQEFDDSDESSETSSQYASEQSSEGSSEQLSEEGLSSFELEERAEMQDRERDRRQKQRIKEKSARKN